MVVEYWRYLFVFVGGVWVFALALLFFRGELRLREKCRKRQILIVVLFVLYANQFLVSSFYFCLYLFRYFVVDDFSLLRLAGPLKFFPVCIAFLVLCAAGYILVLRCSGLGWRRILRGAALMSAVFIAVPVFAYARSEYFTKKYAKELRSVYVEPERGGEFGDMKYVVFKVLSVKGNEANVNAAVCAVGCGINGSDDSCYYKKPDCAASWIVFERLPGSDKWAVKESFYYWGIRGAYSLPFPPY